MAGRSSSEVDGEGRVVSVQGIVLATDWTDDGTLHEISLLAEDEEYVIDPLGAGAALYEHLDDEVRVRGTLHVSDRGDTVIRVMRYEILDLSSVDSEEEETTW